MKLDHSEPPEIPMPNSSSGGGAPPAGPQNKKNWLSRRKTRALARKLYAANDLPAFLALGKSNPEIHSYDYKSVPKGLGSSFALSLLLSCVHDARDEWIVALLASGARPSHDDSINLMWAAAHKAGAEAMRALIDLDPLMIYRAPPNSGRSTDALNVAVSSQNEKALKPLLEEVVRAGLDEANPKLLFVARNSWQKAYSRARSEAAERGGNEGVDSKSLAIFQQFSALAPSKFAAPIHGEESDVQPPRHADPTSSPSASHKASSSAETTDMPAFVSILLAKIEELQMQGARQDASIRALGEEVRALREGGRQAFDEKARPTATAPLSRLGLLGHRFLKASPVLREDPSPGGAPKPTPPR